MPPCFASAVNIWIRFSISLYSQKKREKKKRCGTYMVKEPDTSADIDFLLGDTWDVVEVDSARDMRLARGPFNRSNAFRHVGRDGVMV